MSTVDPVATPVPLTTRNASLADLASLLRVQHDLKLDAVVPAEAIRSDYGILRIAGAGPDGPAGEPGLFRPTELCDGDLAEKLGIPLPYLRKLRATRTDLFDANVNGWLHGTPATLPDDPDVPGKVRFVPGSGPDPRKFLVRCFNSPTLGEGVCRAVLSDRYKRIDNLDTLTAALDAIREINAEIEIDSCDLSERRMVVKLHAPEISAAAPLFLRNYRSPFDGRLGKDLPIMWAGIVIANSETGGSKFQVVPRIVVQVCKNGMTRVQDAVGAVHLGGKMDGGVVSWSEATQQANLELIRAQTRDAVQTFLNVDYLQMVIEDVEEKAAAPLANPADAVQIVSNQLKFSQATSDAVLDHFIRAGDTSVGGIAQAITAYAQVTDNPDLAWDLEALAFDAIDLAAAIPAGRRA